MRTFRNSVSNKIKKILIFARTLQALYKDSSYNCGDKCINKVICTECDGNFCPCGEYCQNRRFQLHQDCKVYPLQTSGKVSN